MKLNYDSSGIVFRSKDLAESILQSECFAAENVSVTSHSWHKLLTKSTRNIHELDAVVNLDYWGIDSKRTDVERAQNVLDAKRKAFRWDNTTIEQAKTTPQFQRAVEMIQKKFGAPFKDGRVLFPYQIETAALMIVKGRLLNAFEMGLGKTLTSLVGTLADDSNHKILVITMSRNVNDWVREVGILGYEDDYIVLENPADLHSDKRIHIVSYEKWASDRIKFARKPLSECPSCGTNYMRTWNKNLGYCRVCRTKHNPLMEERWDDNDLPKKCPDCDKDWKGHYSCGCGYTVIESRKKPLYMYYHNGYDAAVVDEAHYIKNGQSKRSLAVRSVKAPKRYLLSGSPAENGSDDLYWQLGWLTGFSSRYEDPIDFVPFRGYGKAGEEHFREHFSGGKKRRVLDIDSVQPRASNHEALWALLDTLMVRKRQQDEGVKEHIEVPVPDHHRVHLTLHDAERELYDQMLEDFANWYELEQARKEAAEARGDKYKISTIEICAWMDKLRKAASSPWQYEGYDAVRGRTTAKLDFVINKAKDYLRRGKKMLIFSGHHDTIEHLGVLLNGIVPGKTAEYIHGGVKMSYRWELLKKFQDPNDPLSILILSHKTGAESYTLTEAKAVILYDLDFNGKKIEQCYSRAVRLGQKDVVQVYWLNGIDTIDINLHGLVLSKISGVNLAIDRVELDFAELAKEFEGDGVTGAAVTFDYEQFATDMLARGTKRSQIA